MLSFTTFITEDVSHTGGIQHIEHPADMTFNGKDAAEHALKTIKGVTAGRTPVSRKIDDKMSYQIIRTPEGKVGVKYKGPGSHYNFSDADIDTQHGHKPYLAHPLKALLKHVHKVLPSRPGEYQGGFMSTPETRTVSAGKIGHTPNTITYQTPLMSKEGNKLAKSKVSTVIHSELKGPERTAHPIIDPTEFGSHKDVHLVSHTVTKGEANVDPETKKRVAHHLKAAKALMQGHTYEHLAGHEIPMRTYVNSTVDSGERPSVAGYKAHLGLAHDKKIAAVKMAKTKAAKEAEKAAAMAHIDKNKSAFKRSFDIHHHLQQATNHLARGIDKTAHGGYETSIGGEKAGGEGYVAKGLKVVDREGFAKANRQRSAFLKAQRPVKEEVVNELSVPLGATGKRTNVKTSLVAIRMANGKIKRLPPGKSGSSGGGGSGGAGGE